MAHSCPECSQVCYCNGDIDDIVFEDAWAEARCTCCLCPKCHQTPDYCTCYEDQDDPGDDRLEPPKEV